MNQSLNEFTKTPQYDKVASAYSKTHVFVAILSIVLMSFFSDLTFGIWWLLILVVGIFYASLCIAMPALFIRMSILRVVQNSSVRNIVDFILDWTFVALNPISIWFILSAIN